MTVFNPKDLEFHAWPQRQDGGGQHVGRFGGVLLIHQPTGIAVVVTEHRSQLSNRQTALDRLRGLIETHGGMAAP